MLYYDAYVGVRPQVRRGRGQHGTDQDFVESENGQPVCDDSRARAGRSRAPSSSLARSRRQMSLATILHAVRSPRLRSPRGSPTPRPDLLGIVAVTGLAVLAAFVRLWRLSDVGFRGDEAVYAGQAELLGHIGGMDRWFILASRGNSNFLVYQWFVAVVYRVFGVSDTAARVVSATFSVL